MLIIDAKKKSLSSNYFSPDDLFSFLMSIFTFSHFNYDTVAIFLTLAFFFMLITSFKHLQLGLQAIRNAGMGSF